MKTRSKFTARMTTGCAALFVGLAAASLTSFAHAAPLSWTAVLDQQVTSGGRSLRGFALSSDEQSMYGGFIQGSSSAGVRHFTLAGDPPVATGQTFYSVTSNTQNGASSDGHQPKALATDNRGFVYIGSSKGSTSGHNARIIIQDSTLSLLNGAQTIISLSDIDFPGTTGERVGGLAVRNDGGVLYLYVSREHPTSAYVERYVIGGTDIATATLTLDPGFNGSGRFNLKSVFADAADLRGLEVDSDGTIYVTSSDADSVFRISSDLSTVTRQAVNNAYDVALFDGRAFVTSYDAATSAIFELLDDSSLDVLSSFDAFSLFPRNNVAGTGYSGIEIDSAGRIYVVDQFYYCSSSTCGSSGTWGDRVLVSSPLDLMDGGAVPVPASAPLVLLALAAAAAATRRRA